MTPREILHLAYEVAFFPPRLNALWSEWERGRKRPSPDQAKALEMAEMLHARLPESGFVSARALKRLAMYQADARLFGLPRFIRNMRRHFGYPPVVVDEVPPRYVRDIALPPFCRPRHESQDCAKEQG